MSRDRVQRTGDRWLWRRFAQKSGRACPERSRRSRCSYTGITILEVARIPNCENAKTKCPVPSRHEGDMDGPPRISRQRRFSALRRRLASVCRRDAAFDPARPPSTSSGSRWAQCKPLRLDRRRQMHALKAWRRSCRPGCNTSYRTSLRTQAGTGSRVRRRRHRQRRRGLHTIGPANVEVLAVAPANRLPQRLARVSGVGPGASRRVPALAAAARPSQRRADTLALSACRSLGGPEHGHGAVVVASAAAPGPIFGFGLSGPG